jgi:hypothetical protein
VLANMRQPRCKDSHLQSVRLVTGRRGRSDLRYVQLISKEMNCNQPVSIINILPVGVIEFLRIYVVPRAGALIKKKEKKNKTKKVGRQDVARCRSER